MIQLSQLPVAELKQVIGPRAAAAVEDIRIALNDPAVAKRPELLVPPATTEGQAAELRLLHGLAESRTALTPAKRADAERFTELMDHHGGGKLLVGTDPSKTYHTPAEPTLWETWAARQGQAGVDLLHKMDAIGDIGWMVPKQAVDQPRPKAIFPGLDTIGISPPNSSWPSGHTYQQRFRYRTLMQMQPEDAARFRRTSEQLPISRLYAGQHWPNNVLAAAHFADAAHADVWSAHVRGASVQDMQGIMHAHAERNVALFKRHAGPTDFGPRLLELAGVAS